MNEESSIEAELSGEWTTIQLPESGLYAASVPARAIYTVAPFFIRKTRASENYVAIQGVDPPAPIQHVRGGLAAWQIKRARQMMAVQRRPALSIAEIAQACGVTESHFVREFKRSTGVTPHRWAVTQRVLVARGMLVHTRLSLERIAIGSGFFDQSHLSRWFKRIVGVSPRNWQKENAPRYE